MCWFLFNVIGTSVGLGMLLITVFDNWMRGYSIFLGVIMVLLSMFSILINALMVVRSERGPGQQLPPLGRPIELGSAPRTFAFNKVAVRTPL